MVLHYDWVLMYDQRLLDWSALLQVMEYCLHLQPKMKQNKNKQLLQDIVYLLICIVVNTISIVVKLICFGWDKKGSELEHASWGTEVDSCNDTWLAWGAKSGNLAYATEGAELDASNTTLLDWNVIK